jgi:hypothetical protein
MKTMGAGNYLHPEAGLTPEALIRFALSQDVDLVIVGCSTPDEARFLAQMGTDSSKMDDNEQTRLIETVRPWAQNLAYYRGVL